MSSDEGVSWTAGGLLFHLHRLWDHWGLRTGPSPTLPAPPCRPPLLAQLPLHSPLSSFLPAGLPPVAHSGFKASEQGTYRSERGFQERCSHLQGTAEALCLSLPFKGWVQWRAGGKPANLTV